MVAHRQHHCGILARCGHGGQAVQVWQTGAAPFGVVEFSKVGAVLAGDAGNEGDFGVGDVMTSNAIGVKDVFWQVQAKFAPGGRIPSVPHQ